MTKKRYYQVITVLAVLNIIVGLFQMFGVK